MTQVAVIGYILGCAGGEGEGDTVFLVKVGCLALAAALISHVEVLFDSKANTALNKARSVRPYRGAPSS